MAKNIDKALSLAARCKELESALKATKESLRIVDPCGEYGFALAPLYGDLTVLSWEIKNPVGGTPPARFEYHNAHWTLDTKGAHTSRQVDEMLSVLDKWSNKETA